MAEPIYVAQTFEDEHVSSREAAQDWIAICAEEARARGGTWPRCTFDPINGGILFECWKEKPKTEGRPRWGLTPARTEPPQAATPDE